MENEKKNDGRTQLRRLAEKALSKTPCQNDNLSVKSAEDMASLIHELRVHQIELQMQNEELRTIQGELEKTRTRYSHLYDFSPTGYVSMNEKGFIKEANLTLAAMLGTERSFLIGKPLTHFVLKEDQDIFYKHRKHLLETEAPQEYELRMVKNDGHWFHVQLECLLLKNQSEDSKEILATVNDFTVRKLAEIEREKLQMQLSQSQKMESVGRLAGGVAHDFNNMLGIILGNAEMALDHPDLAEPLYGNLEEIRKAANRSADLVRQLLAFARKQTISPKVLDLDETVEGMLKMLRRLVGENINLVWLPGTKVWQVRMDPSQLDQILANLCVNARDAIEDVGKITIETGTTTFDEVYCKNHDGFAPGEYVSLAVNDNGCGMSNETMKNLFEPFFTTKEIGKGTGLGLAMVYGAVKQNNGFINVFSEPGKGTTFQIYLPRYETKVKPISNEDDETKIDGGRETILLVEDEPAILKMTTMMLEKLGYHILGASTPGEAIRMAREHSGEIHMLMTDVIMPEMNGRALARNLIPIFPNIKRLFMSGYTADVIAHHGVLDEGVNFIEKPFSKQDLAYMVRKTLSDTKLII